MNKLLGIRRTLVFDPHRNDARNMHAVSQIMLATNWCVCVVVVVVQVYWHFPVIARLGDKARSQITCKQLLTSLTVSHSCTDVVNGRCSGRRVGNHRAIGRRQRAISTRVPSAKLCMVHDLCRQELMC